MAKLGKPKGSRNKKTLEKLASAASGPSAQNDVSSSGSGSGSGSVAPQSQSILTFPNEVQLQPHATWNGLSLDLDFSANSLTRTSTLYPGFSSVSRHGL